MAIKIDGRSTILMAAGIWMCFCGSLPGVTAAAAAAAASEQAATTTAAKQNGARATKHARRYWKKHAKTNRNIKKIASKSSRSKALQSLKLDDGDTSTALPADVANANAQLASADATVPSAALMTARAEPPRQVAEANAPAPQASEASDSRLVSADQLNDLDRALTEAEASPPLLTMASANAPLVISAPVMISADDSAWGKSSIIGKIFIAFGGLLTFASAARMFMA